MYELKTSVELRQGQGVSDDGPDIKPSPEKSCQAIPGVKEPAAGYAVHADAFKNDLFGEVHRHGLAGNAEERDPAGILDVFKAKVHGGRMAGHLQRGIHSFASRVFSNHLRACLLRIECQVGTHAASQFEAVSADVGGN